MNEVGEGWEWGVNGEETGRSGNCFMFYVLCDHVVFLSIPSHTQIIWIGFKLYVSIRISSSTLLVFTPS